MPVTSCANCAKPISVLPSRLDGTPRFCSRTCRSFVRRKSPKELAQTKAAIDKRYAENHKAECRNRLIAWRAVNPEKVSGQQKRALAKRDPVRRAESYAVWRAKNLERQRLKDRVRKKQNRAYYTAMQVARHARKIQSTPRWANPQAIVAIYQEASRRGLQVDHIVPLKSPKVCGLHWEGNLQLLTASENAKKKNVCWPGMAKAAA